MAAEQKIREELLQQAHGDALTRLASRQLFWQRLEEEARRTRRTHSDLALLLLHVDKFEGIVTIFGQEMGNAVLCGVGKIIRGCIREIDLAARLNNEGLVLCYPKPTLREGCASPSAFVIPLFVTRSLPPHASRLAVPYHRRIRHTHRPEH